MTTAVRHLLTILRDHGPIDSDRLAGLLWPGRTWTDPPGGVTGGGYAAAGWCKRVERRTGWVEGSMFGRRCWTITAAGLKALEDWR